MRLRTAVVVVFAVATVPPIWLVAYRSGAASATVCKTSVGTVTFAPPLPKLGDPKKVTSTLTATGTLGKCTGGNVATAHTSLVTKFTGNCTTLTKTSVLIASPTETITWNTGKTSTVTLTARTEKNRPLEDTFIGKVTKGLFAGRKAGWRNLYKYPTGGCVNTPLARVSYTAAQPTNPPCCEDGDTDPNNDPHLISDGESDAVFA